MNNDGLHSLLHFSSFMYCPEHSARQICLSNYEITMHFAFSTLTVTNSSGTLFF